MSKVNIQIDIPEHIRGNEREQRVLQAYGNTLLKERCWELYKEREISTGTGARIARPSAVRFYPFLASTRCLCSLRTMKGIAEEWRTLRTLANSFPRKSSASNDRCIQLLSAHRTFRRWLI